MLFPLLLCLATVVLVVGAVEDGWLSLEQLLLLTLVRHRSVLLTLLVFEWLEFC